MHSTFQNVSIQSQLFKWLIEMFLSFTALSLLNALEKKGEKKDKNWIATMNTLRYININHIHYHFGLESFQCFTLFQAVILVSP